MHPEPSWYRCGCLGHPGLVGLGHNELALKVVRWHDRRLAATLAQVTHVQRELAIAVHAAALEPGLFEQAQKPLVVLGARARRFSLPSVVAAGVHSHDFAHTAHAMLMFMALDKCVLHPDCLAKYAAAFFRMSRSSVTRLSSAFNLRNSSACGPCTWHSAAGT